MFKPGINPIKRHYIQYPTEHDDVIIWKHFLRYWPFVRVIHRSPVNSPHKGQWGEALMFSLICGRINGWVNNGKAGDLRRHQAHYDVTLMMHHDMLLLLVPLTHWRIESRWVGPIRVASPERHDLSSYRRESTVYLTAYSAWQQRNPNLDIFIAISN